MIRNWVLNLKKVIDEIDFDNYEGTHSYEPLINNHYIRVYNINGYYLNIQEFNLRNISNIELEEVEYHLLKDAIDNFKHKFNEYNVIKFLKPLC